MFKGAYQDNENQGTKMKTKNSSGVIPITAKILSEVTSKDDSSVEYRDVTLHDVIVAGNLIDIQDSDTKLLIRVWDTTGVIDITFFNRSEFDSLSDLIELAQKSLGKPVKIFGTIKFYKKVASINGARMFVILENELIQHMIGVIDSWMYLTGRYKLAEEENHEKQIEMATNMNNNKNRFNNNNNMNNSFNNYSNNPYQSSNVYQFNNRGNQYQQTGVGMRNSNYSNSNITPEANIVLNAIKEISYQNNNYCTRKHLFDYLRNNKINFSSLDGILDYLLNDGYLIDEDEVLKITGNY